MKRWNRLLWFTMILAIIGVVRMLLDIPLFFMYVGIAGIGIVVCISILFYRRNKKNAHLEFEKIIEGCKSMKEIRNENGQLHSLTEPAIVRKNGKEEYYIDGVEVEVDLWKEIVNKSLSIQGCFQIRNIEQRRIAMKYCLTPDKFLENWKELRMINRDKRGNTLYEYTHNELNESIKVLVYKDPSTDREYYSFVPPSMANATSAMAWKFQLTNQEYDNLRFEA